MQHLRLDQAIQNSPLGNPWKSYPQTEKNGTPYPRKTNMSLDNQWLEDVIPTEIIAF